LWRLRGRRFLENWYAKTSMDGIAESAAVSVKTIYRLFAKLLQLGVF
jgi:AcrR family transcriptional regulator